MTEDTQNRRPESTGNTGGTRMTRRGAPSRNPAYYSHTDHLFDALNDPMRFLTRDMVDDTIESGRDYADEGGEGKMRRKLEYDGVDAVLVLAEDQPVVVTGWTEVRDWTRAFASDRWDQDELATIRAFEDEEHKEPWWE